MIVNLKWNYNNHTKYASIVCVCVQIVELLALILICMLSGSFQSITRYTCVGVLVRCILHCVTSCPVSGWYCISVLFSECVVLLPFNILTECSAMILSPSLCMCMLTDLALLIVCVRSCAMGEKNLSSCSYV